MDRASLQERFGIIGRSDAVRQVLDRVRQVARTDITVLIQGESGVGKELIAQALHQLSERRHKTLQIVNCGAIPEGLIESELFGAEKGAYTGAVERRTGYFEEANGGTIFLDEIGEMPLTAQVRLLRVLENGEFSRVGSSKVIKTDVRVIAATNKDLGREVSAGRFREDLYYRLSTVIIRVPPLRERKEDIVQLFEHFQHRFAQQYNTGTLRLSKDARSLLLRYRWPGNIRELRNVAEQSAVLLDGDTIQAGDLRGFLRGVSAGDEDAGFLPVVSGDRRREETDRERELIYRALLELRMEMRGMKDQLAALMATLRGGAAPAAMVLHRDTVREEIRELVEDAAFEIESDGDLQHNGGFETADGDTPLPSLEDAERRLIMEALERFEGNRRQTAQALGISERTLYRKIKEFEDADASA
ncbi:MAG: sigma-54-dependent Fis family transcriptional regulator [Rhodothermales bacterium]|nr:sigma-54-dependent Fis family transcriptional regulator [Rhodothermales bacterium]MBO6778998.1 sigma-54-dependent Fis family transcriptional regulator [Rhodothermales bacterium]